VSGGVQEPLGELFLNKFANEEVATSVIELDRILMTRLERPDMHRLVVDRWLRSRRVEERIERVDEDEVRGTTPGILPPAGVFGVGLHVVEPNQSPRPAIFVLDVLAPTFPQLLRGSPAFDHLFELGARDDTIRDAIVVGMPVPVEHAGPGDLVTTSTTGGTLGACVTTRDPQEAITTAGHAARPAGEAVFLDGTEIGRVMSTDFLGLHRPGETCADIAVIAGSGSAYGPSQMTMCGLARAYDSVVIRSRNNSQQAWIRAVSPSFAKDNVSGAWGNVYITDHAISTHGDSGAPVVEMDRPEVLIGHIVGGHETAYSLVQQADYQFSEAGVTFRP
jgi:hypothetical protein